MTVKLLTAAKMREIDRLAVEAGIPALVLMENAGRAVAGEAMRIVWGTAHPGCREADHDCRMATHGYAAALSDRLSVTRDAGTRPRKEGFSALVLAGPGQNGGDGFCAARHLSSAGWAVTVLFFGDSEKLQEEARVNYDALRSYPVKVYRAYGRNGAIVSCRLVSLGSTEYDSERRRTYPEPVVGASDGISVELCGDPYGPDRRLTADDIPAGRFDVVIDALLGTGQKGDPRPPVDAGVRIANNLRRLGVPVVACDVPTGVDADTGGLYEPAVTADVTVTMGFAKIGLYSYPGRANVGRIVVENLGIPPGFLDGRSEAEAFLLEDAGVLMPVRRIDHHKGQSGHVTVIAGSTGMAGAAVLSAKAALRAGAGTVTLLCPGDVYRVCASMAPEVMTLPCGAGPVFTGSKQALDTASSFIGRSSCIVLGPGFGRDGGQADFLDAFLPGVSAANLPCVLDADGLNALPALGGLSYLAKLKGKFILTPHPGEMARLVGADVPTIGSDRPGFAVRAALDAKSVVCLKGAGTCVANISGDLRVNTSGDPAMATAGSGDVLSGVIAALVSQGLEPFEASCLGVFWHGLAGETAHRNLGAVGALAGDICDLLPESRRIIERRQRPLSPRSGRCPF